MISRGLRFSDISNRYKSAKDNNSTDKLKFRNLRDGSNPNNSINLGAGNTKGKHNTKSLKENLI